MISEIRKKIVRKNGSEAVLIKLIVIARVMGYESSEPVEEAAFKLGIEVIKMKKYKVIHKNDLTKLLHALIRNTRNTHDSRNANNTRNSRNRFEANKNFQ